MLFSAGEVFTKKHGLYCLSHPVVVLLLLSFLLFSMFVSLFFELPSFLTLWKVNGEGGPRNGQNNT